MPYRVVGIAATALVLALVGGASIARSVPSSSAVGRIAFTSGTDNGSRLLVMQFYYFYALALLALATPIVFARRLES